MTTIKITPETQERIKDFTDGIGGTYDSAIKLLLEVAKQQADESDVMVGVRLREMHKTLFPKQKNTDDTAQSGK